MESRWSDREAAELVARLAPRWGEDLALRVYTSRLIGRDPDLVLHGGGNTSLKGTVTTLVGERVEALFVKGSGWDLAAIEPPGLPAVDLAHLRKLRALHELSDEEMVNQLRTHLFDAGAPNPSVETLLHAFLPHRFIDHTHADVALVVTNQPRDEAEAMVREAFGPRWAIVPYVMPGFALAKLAAEVYERDPSVEGLVLMNHGLFTFADDARTAYERMIASADRAERFVRARARACRPTGCGARLEVPPAGAAARLAPVLRGALAEPTGDADRPWRRMILEHRASEETLDILAGPDAARIAAANPLTPDHVIRTKGPALLLPGDLPLDDAQALRERLDAAVATYRAAYDAYFDANRQRARTRVTKLDSFPRVVLVPGVGVVAAGRTKQEARIAADIAEHTLGAKALANAIGRYAALGDADLFDMEYWSLEQAKLGGVKEAALAGQVAQVTGAAGAIGFAICQKLIDAGAHVVAADLGGERLDAAVGDLDPRRRGLAAGVTMDVTEEHSVAAGFAETCRLFGGVDILVLNAGVAHVRPIARPRPCRAAGLLPAAEPAQGGGHRRARRQRGRVLRLQPDPDDGGDAPGRRRRSRCLPPLTMPLEAARLHVFSDFDGTITAEDTLVFLARRLGGGADHVRESERLLRERRLTPREVIARDVGGIRAPFAEAAALLRAEVAIDPGFAPFACWCAARGIRL